ncbi:MAG: phosphoglycolate phosphatase [Alphaproteobacteria bacterium]|nr:phosphoglycolate phosphatase [Alphaproteobacteria bacterium]
MPLYAGYTIVFDLDGTLVDTAPDLTAALNHVLVSEGRQALPLAEVRNLVGHGARALIERGMGAAGHTPAEPELQRLLQTFLSYYGANIASHSTLFPGVTETLAHFRAQQARLGVCTNKPAGLSEALFTALNMQGHFDAVLGSDSLPVRKPDPLHLTETIRKAGGDPARAVMVGDSATDVNTARAANIPVVLVSFGYTQIPARELGADKVIDRFDALTQVLPGLLQLDPRGQSAL